MGPHCAKVNGTYNFTTETLNGKPVYSKEGESDWWLYFGTDRAWFVSNTANKEANKCLGWARTETGLLHPTAAKAWTVNIDEKFVPQPVKAFIVVSLCVAYIFLCPRFLLRRLLTSWPS